MAQPLPIDGALAPLIAALEARGLAVLQAPPGAGKTTRVPLQLIDAPWLKGQKIVMLEPRRLAARNAAHRMAETLGSIRDLPDVRARFAAAGTTPLLTGPTELAALLESDVPQWQRVVAATGIKVE